MNSHPILRMQAPQEYPTPKPARTTLPFNLPSLWASNNAIGIVEETVFPQDSKK